MAGSRLAARLRRIDPGHAGALVIGVAAFAVYRATLMPGLGAWDTGEAQTVLPLLGTLHPTGFPAYTVLGWIASLVLGPLGSPAFGINLLSAILVASAVGTTVLVTRRLGAPVLVAMAAAAGFALTPIVWRVATVADVHALHLALLVAIVALLLRWEALVAARMEDPDNPDLGPRADRGLVLAAAVFGVALANHALTLLLIPAAGLFVLAVDRAVVRRPRLIAAALGACLGVTVLLYLELPLRAGPFRAPLVYGHPETWSGFWDVVFARQFQGDVGRSLTDVSGKVADVLELGFRQFGILLLLVPSGLLLAIVRYPRYALLSGVAMLATVLFASTYKNAAIDRYYAGPAFLAWTWLAILGGAIVTAVVQRLRPGPAAVAATTEPADATPAPARRPVGRGSLLGALVSLTVGLLLLVPSVTQLQPRLRAEEDLRDVWVHQWLDEAFATMDPGAVVLSWWSYSTPLWYGQLVEHRRPDVWIVDDRTRLDEGLGSVADVIEANLDTRPVYLVRVTQSEIDALGRRYEIEPVDRPGNMYRVVGRLEEGA